MPSAAEVIAQTIKADALNIVAQAESLISLANPPPVSGPAPSPSTPAPSPSTPTPPSPPLNPAMEDLIFFTTHDDKTGPTREHWSEQANVRWDNVMGDWLDGAGTMQGKVPFAIADVKALGQVKIKIDEPQKMTKGIMLQYVGKSSPYATFDGRLGPNPPVLRATRANGSVVDLPCLSFATWVTSTGTAQDTRLRAKISTQPGHGVVVFDIPADVVTAELLLQVIAKGTPNGQIQVFALRPPGIMLPRLHGGEPVLGIAATRPEAELASHPLVIRATDGAGMLTSIKEGGTFATGVSIAPTADIQILTTHGFPGGGRAHRGRFLSRTAYAEEKGKTLAWADQNGRGGLGVTSETSPADLTDPRRPAIPGEMDLYYRVYVMLEDDWRSRNDANKAAIGWDMRYGFWTDAGYWQQTTGNGGSRGSGLKKLVPPNTYSGQKREQYVYEGHSIRMEFGIATPTADHPFDGLFPIQSYVYNLDQFDFNGQIMRHGNAMIERGRVHCIEQRIRMNSVGPMTDEDHEWEAMHVAKGWLPASRNRSIYVDGYDELGNGGARKDGLMQTFLDGIEIDKRENLRWRRHPDMGVGSTWTNWFFGGKQAAEVTQHWQHGPVVLARAYVGPQPN